MASLIFGCIPFLVKLIDINGNTLFALRVIVGFAFLLIYFLLANEYKELFNSIKNIMIKPKRLGFLLLGAGLIGLQWWIFIWAPANDLTKELALGYFILPLSTALMGKLVFKEKINTLRKVAILLALTGISIELFQHHSISWVSTVVFVGYPIYFTVRKKMDEKVVSIVFFEHICFIPVALYLLIESPLLFSSILTTPFFLLLIVLFGLIGIISVLLYIQASLLLPLSLFGMLSYLEPSLLFLVATLVINEKVEASQWIFYSFIFSATFIAFIDSIKIFINESKKIVLKRNK